MKNLFLITVFLGLILCQVQSAMTFSQKNSPVIGVYTQPSKHDGHNDYDTEYILGSYQNWLAQHGARIVPVPFSASKEQLKQIFNNINGLLFTGGGLDLNISAVTPHTEGPGNLFVENAKYLVELAKEANSQGDYFPVYGICQGFELMLILEHDEKKHDILTIVKNDNNVSRSLKDYNKNSSLFTHAQDYLSFVETHDSLFYFHDWAVTEESFNKSAASQVYSIEGYSYNKTNSDIDKTKDYRYIAAIQGKEYPFYAIQFHPEYQQFEFFFDFDKSFEATQFSSALSLFFVEETKKSDHKYESNDELVNSIITNVNPILKDKPETWQVYYFQREFYPFAKYEQKNQSTHAPWYTWLFLSLFILFFISTAFLGYKIMTQSNLVKHPQDQSYSDME